MKVTITVTIPKGFGVSSFATEVQRSLPDTAILEELKRAITSAVLPVKFRLASKNCSYIEFSEN